MNFSTTTKPIEQLESDLLIAFASEDKGSRELTEIDKLLNGKLENLKKQNDFTGKKNQTLALFPDFGIPRLLVLGLGKSSEQSLETLREVVATGIKQLKNKNIKSVTITLPTIARHGAEERTEAMIESLLLSNYKFTEYKSGNKNQLNIENVEIVIGSPKDRRLVNRAIKTATAISQGVKLARDLGNHPSNVATPTHIAKHAKDLEKISKKIKVKVLGPKEIKKEKMEALLAVSQGSSEEPRFVIAEYTARKTAPTIALVGKGITFDSGGISLKPSEKMEEMKYDMAGAATVLGIIRAAAETNIQVNLIGLIAASENLPSGTSVKPGDVIKTRMGKTVEIINTDAEGRLVLSDALDYAKKYKPALTIDYATLTGAMVVALGDDMIGAFSKNDKYLNQLTKSADATGEKTWPMPLEDSYKKLLKSEVADIRNIATTPYGGAIHAALFLENFIDYPWIHLDIAGVAWATREKPYRSKGATGTGVRLTVNFLKNFKK